ncbi:MAG: hypothetical protein OHK0047_09110 [Leptolyngbyaceae cyanobacterium]|uniref:TVP38/TMEM64 family protein n=1 Tax=Leptodesmis sichuanensis TaxID=2906798 RepID=UPI001F2E14F8|nr:TVP38/TMEM64 family protein [Leptodesmis sichuanensis]UIE39979.1 TVP38/TMEM64 family protein [Leptodesmis sichuanensis A121]
MQIGKQDKLWVWAGIGLTTLVLVCLLSSAKALFNQEFLVLEFQRSGGYAPLLFVLIFTIATSLGFPGNVMAVVGGALFGLFWGTIWSLIGSTLGAIGAFWLARYFLHGPIERQFGHYPMLRRLNRAIATYPFSIVLAVRFTPLSPFSLVNFLFGLTPISLKTYALGTLLGLIPLTLTYSWLGLTGQQLLHGGDRLPFFLALGILTLLSVLPLFFKKAAGDG